MNAYEQIPKRFNLAEYFLDRRLDEGRGSRVALYCENHAYTYEEVARYANRIGHVLRDLGVRREERVILALTDGLEFVATWYAILKVGAVVVEGIYTFLPPKDYAYYLNYSRAGIAVVDEATREHVAAVAHQCPHLRHRLVAGDVRELMSGEVSLRDLASQASDELDPADTRKDDFAVWKFTTGTTGHPKAAVHCQHDPVVSFHNYALGVVGYREDDVILPVPKMFFGYGRDATMVFTFGVGAAGIVFPERSTPERLFELAERYQPTIMIQVPTMMHEMVSYPAAKERELSFVRLAVSSGEALPSEVHRRWLKTFGVEVIEGVGSSEAYHIYISNRPGSVRVGSAGQVVPGYNARIRDHEGDDLADGQIGELWISGDSAALFYWNDYAKSKHTFVGSWIRTGDMFVRDEDGYFWYRGRADDLLKVAGIWMAPLEIETCLLQHPYVVECAVVGYEESGLQLPRAYIVATQNPSKDLAQELKHFVKEHLSPHKYPRDVRFLNELPRTASGKIDRRRLTFGGVAES